MAQVAQHTRTNYMTIFWWLAALTAVELAVIFLPLTKIVIGILLCGLALGKAALVAMYFMHLRFETRTLGLVALTPLAIGFLLVMLLVWDGNPVYHTSGVTPAADAPATH
jgi:caa(3)-type oxidase subunit IV